MRIQDLIALAAGSLVAAATLAAPVIPVPEGKVEGEFWEMKQKMVMEGMPMQMPMQTVKVCQPKNAPDDKLAGSDDKNCRMTSQKRVGNKFYWEVECTGKEKYSGKGEFERLGPDQYRGKMTMVMQEGTATMEMEGRKLGGTCDPYADARKANAAMAQSELQACRSVGEELGDPAADPRLGGADYGCQTRNKKAYCDGVKATAPKLQQRAELRSRASRTSWRKAYGECGLDADGLLRKSCAAAAAERDFGFVLDLCPEEGRAIAAAQCTGRDLTAWRSAGVIGLCAKYSPEAAELIRADRRSRGLSEDEVAASGDPAQTAPAPGEDAATPAKQGAVDKLKKGAKGLKDLFKVPRP